MLKTAVLIRHTRVYRLFLKLLLMNYGTLWFICHSFMCCWSPPDFKIKLLPCWKSTSVTHPVLDDGNIVLRAGKVFGFNSEQYGKAVFFFPASGGRKQWVPPICCSCKVPWGESCILPHSTKLKRGREGGKKAVRLIDSLCHVCCIF